MKVKLFTYCNSPYKHGHHDISELEEGMNYWLKENREDILIEKVKQSESAYQGIHFLTISIWYKETKDE